MLFSLMKLRPDYVPLIFVQGNMNFFSALQGYLKQSEFYSENRDQIKL